MKLFLLFAWMLISGIANGQRAAPQRTLTAGRSHMLLQFAKNATQALLEKLAAGGITVPGYIADLDGRQVPCIAVTAIVALSPDVDAKDGREIADNSGLSALDNPGLLADRLLVRGNRKQLQALAGWDEVYYILPASKELTDGIPVPACAGTLTSQGPAEQALPAVKVWDAPGLDVATVDHLKPKGTVAPQESYASSSTPASPNPPAPGPASATASPLLLAVITPPSFTTVSSLSISGTASGGSGTVEVSWTSSNGASGVAQGASNWVIPSIPMRTGSNIITITAKDSLMDQLTSGVTVSYQPASPAPSPTPAPNPPSGPDTTPPSLTILTPATSNYSTSEDSLVVNGTATDNVEVASVTWATSNGNSGTATGTSNWSTPAIPLYIGSTTIVITASDAAGNTTWRSLTVTRE